MLLPAPALLRRGAMLAIAFGAVLPLAAAIALAPRDATDAFPLVVNDRAAPIVLPADAPEVVQRAARDFAADVARVTGQRPEIVLGTDAPTPAPRVLVVQAEELAGRWEAFALSATADELRIAGSDRRALAYGLYELSRRIGVSPWHWWADVPVTPRDELKLTLEREPVEAPAVRYRGIFLNDEGWGLEPWAATTFEPEVGTIGPRTYARLFELLLRLRGNTLWPAMHPGTVPFHQVPGNAAIADAYAIVLGSSHAEPMLRNNVGEWKADKAEYNFLTNPAGVLRYWEQRVQERRAGESLFTLGMRGIHDSAILGPRDQAERIATLERIFAAQRKLLGEHLGGGDPTRIAQFFCPYKEVLDDYLAGLRVPDDVTIVWPDDNFGYIRRFASPAERARSGGLGVYYHLSYLGAPLSWLWLDAMPPALIWTEMMRAYEQGARTVWIANVGDLKANERSTEFFLDLAWHADRTGPEEPERFLRRMAARDFGTATAEAIASLWSRHVRLAFGRRPEHLQWHLPFTPYRPTELTEREMERRLRAYEQLTLDVEEVRQQLPAAAGDAYFQLVEYPVLAAAAANARYFGAELARVQKARGDGRADATFARTDAAERRIRELTLRYNSVIAGGKWQNVVTTNGLSPREWRRFQPDPGLLPLNSPAQAAIAPPPPAAPETEPLLPSAARAGDFVVHDGVVSIHAGHFTGRHDQPDGAGWRRVAGLGRTGSAVTVLPSTATLAPATAPRLSYRFHVDRGGPATVHVRLLPTHPLVPGHGLRLAVAIDAGAPRRLAVTSGFDPGTDAWKERVLANAVTVSLPWPEELAAGAHTLDLVAVDAGVVVDQIVIDLGGLRPSYDGPEETRVRAAP